MTQNDAVLKYLREGGSLTPLKAQRLFGVSRLAARVLDLRKEGHLINSGRRKVRGRNGPTTVSEYSMGVE
mgnify:CR=1 FL=1|jgi:hypothetical protein